MQQWDTGFIIDGYVVEVKLKYKDKTYYAQADSFFLVASSGETLDEAMERLKKVYLRIREVVFKNFIKKFGIEKHHYER